MCDILYRRYIIVLLIRTLDLIYFHLISFTEIPPAAEVRVYSNQVDHLRIFLIEVIIVRIRIFLICSNLHVYVWWYCIHFVYTGMDFPVFSEKDITNLVADVFGLDVLYTKRLDGYEDVNFHIRVALTSRNLHLSSPSEDGYVLKISSPLLSSNLDNIDAQNAMMLYLNENLHSIQVTLPVMSAKGNYREVISIPPENG